MSIEDEIVYVRGQQYRFSVVDLAQESYDWVECPVCYAVLRSVGSIEHLKSHGIAEPEEVAVVVLDQFEIPGKGTVFLIEWDDSTHPTEMNGKRVRFEGQLYEVHGVEWTGGTAQIGLQVRALGGRRTS